MRVDRRPRVYLAALLAAIALSAGCGEESGKQPAIPDLEYVIARNADAGTAVALTLTASGTPDGTTVFVIDETWGGAGDVADQVLDLQVRDSSGTFLPVDRPDPHRWVVTHAPGERLVVSYRLEGGSPEDRDRHRYLPVVQIDLILLIGHTSFVRPESLLEDGEVDLKVRWVGFSDPGWKIVTSFGPCDGSLHVRLPLEDLIHTFYSAGRIRLHEREVAGSTLHLAMAGTEWRFDDEAFCDMVAHIMEFEREFFREPQHPPYTVILVPYPGKKPDSWSKGGTNLVDSYVLYLTTNGFAGENSTGLEPLETLITHEYFHNWNKPGPDDDAMHWFSEGFTVFYERRVLCGLGLFSPEECVDHLNQKIREYVTSPHAETPNDVYVRSRMLDQKLQSLPYVRGAFIAVMVDHEIRRVSGGARDLDDFMRQKHAAEQSSGRGLGNDDVFEMLAVETSPEFATSIRAVALDGAPATLAPNTYAGCLAMETVHLSPFELGFDFEASRRNRSITGVQEATNAYAAGLRNGQQLTGWSVSHGNADKQVELVVVDNGEKRTVTYMPQAAPVPVPQFKLLPGSVVECAEIF